MFGLIQIFTGDGKGKTTAALGEALRSVAIGKKVGIVFFDKGGDHYSERKILDKLGIFYLATGRDRIVLDVIPSDLSTEASAKVEVEGSTVVSKFGRFDFSIQDIDKKEAARGLNEAKKLFDAKYDLVILDEINSTTTLGMISEDKVLDLINNKPEKTELILTGRNAPESFIQKSHLVTEMRLVKHYFYNGVKAREGLDY